MSYEMNLYSAYAGGNIKNIHFILHGADAKEKLMSDISRKTLTELLN